MKQPLFRLSSAGLRANCSYQIGPSQIPKPAPTIGAPSRLYNPHVSITSYHNHLTTPSNASLPSMPDSGTSLVTHYFVSRLSSSIDTLNLLSNCLCVPQIHYMTPQSPFIIASVTERILPDYLNQYLRRLHRQFSRNPLTDLIAHHLASS